MQDAYTFEERCGDDDALIEDDDSSSVRLKCIRKIGGRSGSAEVKESAALSNCVSRGVNLPPFRLFSKITVTTGAY